MEKVTIVLGLGVSGRAAAELLLKQGALVLGIDSDETIETRHLQSLGMFVQKETDPIDWDRVDRLIVSPGISPEHGVYRGAKESGVAIIGEAELALSQFPLKTVVAVTGTNGKTTVALLVEHILNASGIKAKALGNVGTALSTYLMAPGNEEALIVELSSFQLETMRARVFDAAVLLNITADHLDRYDSMEEYAKAKCHLQHLLKDNAPFFVQSQVAATYGHLLTASNAQIFENENIESLLPLDYREGHDCENGLAAWALCRPFSIAREQFCRALATFQKPPHRLEFVREVGGVSFYDDSKGTNIDAVIQAVRAMKGPVVLIAGGVDKGASYLPWKEHLMGKIKAILAIGQAAPKIYSELHPYFHVTLVETLPLAVRVAAESATVGDSVLLSPGCSSYDMFRDYMHRGQEFQRCVRRLLTD